MSRAYEGDGVLINSEEFSNIENRSAIQDITKKLSKLGKGYKTINYKLRDWGISRQRYWGCPIPIIHCDQCGPIPVPYEELPVLLPEDAIFTGSGNPLETSESFVNVECPKCGKKGRRETDTMDTFIDSSWYFFAFCDPPSLTTELPYKKDIVNYWGNVDLYVGGIEHAILHLIYARFFTKVSRDLGLHKFDEPFQKLLTQGMINKVQPFCPDCKVFLMKADLKKIKCKICGNTDLIQKSVKMSKSYGNTVDPGEIIDKYGADTARFFILFGASPESGLEWNDEGINFAYKFVRNFFHLLTTPIQNKRDKRTIRDELILYNLNKTVKLVTESITRIAIRDAINYIIQFVSDLTKYKEEGIMKKIYNECREKLLILFHPIVPHVTEEIWEFIRKDKILSLNFWPTYNNDLLNIENEYKWNLLNSIVDDIKKIMLATKIKEIKKTIIITAREWKYKFYSLLMTLIEKTKNQGEIMKELMKDKQLKVHSKFINQTTSKILKNLGKYSKYNVDRSEENQFFNEIKPLIKKRVKCDVEVILESKSEHKKASQALPGRPAVVLE
ncbi:hypothetical protein LCGC14_0912900 [marine sediment metagenome]|uniref:leucine--tRNA ligase n=1 Tax=marine sediment metagenome TaxID=412755 RepID=A0A0F9NT07_9ZZZZ